MYGECVYLSIYESPGWQLFLSWITCCYCRLYLNGRADEPERWACKEHRAPELLSQDLGGWSWLTSGRGLIKNSALLPGLSYCWCHRLSFPPHTGAATSQWLWWLKLTQRRTWRVVFWCSIASGLSVCACVCTAVRAVLIGWGPRNHFIWLAKLSRLILVAAAKGRWPPQIKLLLKCHMVSQNINCSLSFQQRESAIK